MLVNAADMLKKAEAGKYGLGAFNTNNLEWTPRLFSGPPRRPTPLILQGYRWCPLRGWAVSRSAPKHGQAAVEATRRYRRHFPPRSQFLGRTASSASRPASRPSCMTALTGETFQLNLTTAPRRLVEACPTPKGTRHPSRRVGIGSTGDGVTSSGELALIC